MYYGSFNFITMLCRYSFEVWSVSLGDFHGIQLLLNFLIMLDNFRPPDKSIVVFVFNVPPTAKVIWRRGHSLKSDPTD